MKDPRMTTHLTTEDSAIAYHVAVRMGAPKDNHSDATDYRAMLAHERRKAFNKANLAAMLVPLPCERP